MAIDDNTSYELTGAQVKDLASKINAKANSSSLATVATSGSYTDLINTPVQPTVYDGTLTIQQNGATKGTFTANQSSASTVNIETIYSVDVSSTQPVTQVVSTAMIQDEAITTAKIDDEAITTAKIDFASVGGTIKLEDVPYTSFTTSVSTSYQLDLRTLFCNSNANREFYFDALLVDIKLFTPVQSSAKYFRLGTLSTSNACHRRMITFSGSLAADSNDAPNIILSANNELSETLIVTPVNSSLYTSVDSVTRFVFSHYAGTQFNDDFRFNVGSFVRMENMPNGKVPCFIETAPTAGKMTIYGVRYGR